jgi:drug/metabolite transporter (DMT)-like permease
MTIPGQSGAAGSIDARIADPRGGILLIVVSGIFFAGLDAGAKHLTVLYPILQITWGRYLFQLFILPFILGRVRPRDLLRTRRPVLQVLRGLLLMGATLTFFVAVTYIPLADSAAIGAVAPLLVTALAIPLLGEKVGARRWAAVIIGLFGALIIIRPGFGTAHWATVMPLATALCFALYQIVTRILAASDPAVTTFLYTAIVGIILSSAVTPFIWVPMSGFDWLVMIGIGVLGGGGHYCIIQAMRRAQATVLAPFGFIQLIWVTIAGFLIFDDFPDIYTITGAAIVVSSSIYVFYREGVVKGTGA